MQFSAGDVAGALLLLGLLMLIGRVLRAVTPWFRRVFLPSSIIAGFIGLLLGPQVLGRLGGDGWLGSWVSGGVFPSASVEVWREIPGLLISVVFAGLFLGRELVGPRQIWRLAGPQAAFGQTMAWGQYVIGIALALLVLGPMFDLPAAAGALIEIGFQGGHGTAAGLSDTYEEFGFDDGRELALALATIGVVSGLLLGALFVNIATRSERIRTPRERGAEGDGRRDATDPQQHDEPDESRREKTSDPLTVQWGVIALAIGLAWLLKQGLTWVENSTWGGEDGIGLLRHIPLFPLAMITGVGIQFIAQKADLSRYIDRRLIDRISGSALDVIIVAAIASLNLGVIGEHVWSVLILAGAGMAWNVAALWLLAPRIMPDHWFTRGVGDFGQSMGMTVTGLLLMRIADPDDESQAVEAFGYKQLLFEPVVGGGIWTASAIPLIAQLGGWAVLGICAALCVGWAGLGWWLFGRGRASADEGSP